MGSQQLEGPRDLENSHLLTYFSIGIANKSQHHMQETKFTKFTKFYATCASVVVAT
jgi:hypothetical protein